MLSAARYPPRRPPSRWRWRTLQLLLVSLLLGGSVWLLGQRLDLPTRGHLLGRWQDVQSATVLEFRPNGDVYLDQELFYAYRRLSDTEVQLVRISGARLPATVDWLGDPQREAQSAVITVTVSVAADWLTITPAPGASVQFRRLR